MKTMVLPATVCVAAMLAGCRSTPRQTSVLARTPVRVQAITVSETTVPAIYTVSGTVRARTAASLSSRVLAYVQSVHVREGDRVAAGQELVTLEAQDLDVRYKQAESVRQEILSALPEAASALSEAKANLDLAEVTFGRMQDLYRKRSISEQEFDEATAKVKAARAGYEKASAREAQAKSRIAQSEAELQSSAITRQYSRILAPFAGVVTARNVEPGILATPGDALLTIERSGAFRFEASVEESRLASIRPGQKAAVTLDALHCTMEGRVSEIAPIIDAGSRTYVVKIDLPGSRRELRSGIFGRASFEGAPQKALMIPSGAISHSGQLESVWVEEQETARLRLLTTGQNSNGQTTILSGLRAGDKVIYPAPAALQEGAPLEVSGVSEVQR